MRLKKIVLLFCVGLSSCSPNGLSDFQCEGEERCRALTEELAQIQDRETLLRTAPSLKKKFNELVTLMIQAREFQEKHPDAESAFSTASSASYKLQQELSRIYSIEGGREVIEGAQQEALVRLDAFERACLKKRQAIR
jgi:hypothetical protein